ncbi:MAG: ParB/RepB/Spo0J family partition protein [Planctomycetes bacterium]|nr:ParB/RepB/Spo0J family partition protein [Planctomycetota bacterium]
MSDRKLGKGLDFLIKRTSPLPTAATPAPEATEVAPAPATDTVAVDAIQPNPYQPRREFDIEGLNDLIESIRQHGVLQPIALRRRGDQFELISGERRWRASRELGLERIPARVLEVDDQQMLELALIENIQRQDLDPIEKAKAYRRLMDEFRLTQEEAAQRLSQKRSTVANFLRLLDLPLEIREQLKAAKLSMGHARALAGVSEAAAQRRLAQEAADRGYSVRELERAIQGLRTTPARTGPLVKPRDANMVELERRLAEALGGRASVVGTARRGKVQLEYRDPAALQRILECFEAGAKIVADRYFNEELAD